MEDILRGTQNVLRTRRSPRLNPCFNGRYSQSGQYGTFAGKSKSLNPCFNGRYSQSNSKSAKDILLSVLILVLMEDTLRDERNYQVRTFTRSLNPCFNGRYSQS